MKQPLPKNKLASHAYHFQTHEPTVSNDVADQIKDHGLTFKEASARIGVSRQALDLYIRGELQPTIEVALKLSLLLDVPVDELFSLEDAAWMTTAKDKEGRTIYYDRLKEELLSGEAMKGKSKTVRYSIEMNEDVSAKAFKKIVKEAENNVVREAKRVDVKKTHTRDTLARLKERVRTELEKKYPIRYEVLYTPIDRLDERR